MYAPTTHTAAAEAPTFGAHIDLMTPADIVTVLGAPVTERRVRGWIQRGVLPGTNPARGVWRVKRADFDAWIDAGQPRVTPAAAPRARRLPEPERIQPTRGQRFSRRGGATTELNLT